MDSLASCKILIFEDDTAIRSLLTDFFASQGAGVAVAVDGQNSLARIRAEEPDLIILDVVLPFQDGFAILKQLRSSGSTVPVLMLTEKTTVEDKVTGLELGADDSLAKPFETRELLARARVLLRRTLQARQTNPSSRTTLELDPLCIDLVQRQVTVRGIGTVPFTKTEFDLLLDLADNVGRIRTYAQLMQDVLGYDPGVQSRALSMHIANIRKKFEQLGMDDVVQIRTIVGVGYALGMNDKT